MEKKLIKKFYIECGLFGNKNRFSMVKGTTAKKSFTVKERTNIIGDSWDVRIPLDSPYLFDDFKTAADTYIKLAAQQITDARNLIVKIEDDIKNVEELIRQVTLDTK